MASLSLEPFHRADPRGPTEWGVVTVAERQEATRRKDGRGRLVKVLAATVGAVLVLGLGAGAVVAASQDSPRERGSAQEKSSGKNESRTPGPGEASASEDGSGQGSTEPEGQERPGSGPGKPSFTGDDEARRPRAKPVPLGESAAASDDIVVEVSQLERVQGLSLTPGEVGGDALRVTVRASNNGEAALPLEAAVVNLYYGGGNKPASFLMEPGSTPFPDKIPAGGSAEGVFVFTVPPRPAIRVVIEADLDHSLRIVSFVGLPRDVM